MTVAAFKAALSAWVVAATGLEASRVVWTHKEIGLGLPMPYVTLAINNEHQIGEARRSTVERVDDPSAPEDERVQPGEELEHLVETSHELLVTMTAWDEDPFTLLLDVKRKASLPTIRDALREARVGLGECEDVQEKGGVREPCATMQVHCFIRLTASEYLTYIETAEATLAFATPPETRTFDLVDGTVEAGTGG